MKSKRHSSIHDVAVEVGLNPKVGELAELKCNLTTEIIKATQEEGVTHKEVAEVSGVPRSAVTKIVNRSLQSLGNISRKIPLVSSSDVIMNTSR